MKTLENTSNTAQIEARLNKYAYLSKNTLPGYPDAKVFAILETNKRFPDRHCNPHFYHWFIIMKQFSSSTINKWINDQVYLDQDDSLINQFIKTYAYKQRDSSPPKSDVPSPKSDSPTFVEYTIEIGVKTYSNEQIDNFRKMLQSYRAELSQPDSSNNKIFRIICKINPGSLDKLEKKISEYVQYDQLSVKRNVIKGAKSLPSPQKNLE